MAKNASSAIIDSTRKGMIAYIYVGRDRCKLHEGTGEVPKRLANDYLYNKSLLFFG